MNIYDAHTHLNDDNIFLNWKEHVYNFSQIGGKGITNISVDDIWLDRGLQIINENDTDIDIKTTIGYHPSCVVDNKIRKGDFNDKLENLRNIYTKYKNDIVGIGECGIDVHFPGSEEVLEEQKEIFDMQCGLAQELGLPIVIHTRDDFESTFDILKNYKNLTVYWHCRGYDVDQIKTIKDFFPSYFIGFVGNITFKKADNVRNSFLQVPLENIVMETDAPYLAPVPYRGKQNNPSYIIEIYKYCAELLGFDLEEYSKQIEHNFYDLYGFN